jgi:hypothetical protein
MFFPSTTSIHREVISESKLSIYDTCFIWKALKSYLVKKDKAIIFIWLATCDLTTKTGKYLELTHNTSRYYSDLGICYNVQYCMVGTPKKDYATVFCIWLVFVL